MKRKKIISGKDGDTKLVVTVEIEAPTWELGRDESQRLMDDITGLIMTAIPRLPFVKMPLVRLVVR